MRTTFHLVPEPDWSAMAVDGVGSYAAPSLATEGFIHCTDGADALIDTANRYYRDDRRPYLALVIDLDATGSPWRFDDAGERYPHVYGPIARGAIVGVQAVERAADGTFIRVAGRVTS